METTVFYLIIGIVVFNFILDKALDFLNDSRKQPQLPEVAKGIYDEATYQKWVAYDKVKGRFSQWSSSISFIGTMLVLVLGGFGWLDTFLRTELTTHPIGLALAYLGILTIASSLLGLPFELYDTFVIEARFDFNKTTWQTFIGDKIKGALLGALIGGGLLALIIWFYESVGSLFWLYAWAVISVFSIFMTMFAASWILPLFNKLTPLPDGTLRDSIVGYCEKVDFQLDNLFVMDGSKRSTKANAFFSGLGPKKKIVLYDTLIEKQSVEEITAVLAHEVGHYKKKHTLLSVVLSIAQTGAMLFLFSLFVNQPEFSLALGAAEPGFHLGLIAFGILYTPLSMVLGIGMNLLSRKNEFEADAYARETYDGSPLETALKKLHVDSLSNLTPHPAYVFVHYSHPPLLERLKALKA